MIEEYMPDDLIGDTLAPEQPKDPEPKHWPADGAALTIVTSTHPERLTKRWRMTNGKPHKEGAGTMTEGNVSRTSASNPEELAAVLLGLQPNQALIFGLPPADQHRVTTTAKLPLAEPGTIARTAEAFQWNAGWGWLLLDYDPAPGAAPLTRDAWLARLFEVAPELEHAPRVWSVSSSSAIRNADTGEQVTGIRGQRLYILVADARDIPRAGAVLFDRLWLAGYGYYAVSKSGALLARADVDPSVWQTNRLDFAAPPVCLPPLECRRPDPMVWNNDAAPASLQSALPDLTPEERAQLTDIRTQAQARPDLLTEQDAARELWVGERLAAMPASTSETEREQARENLRQAVEQRRLVGDFELTHLSGKHVTVADLLDNPDQWHGERFHDPLEPDYSNGDKRIAWANLKSGGAPYLYSHAHGGTRYRLMRPVLTLKLLAGELPATVGKVLDVLRLSGEVFERAGYLVRLADSEAVLVEIPWLQTYLEGVFRFERYDGRSGAWRTSDCPGSLAQRLMAARGEWELPQVSGIVSFPVMRPDGTVIEHAGHDAATGLLFLDSNPHRPAPRPLDRLALVEALRRIWAPFEQFPFADEVSRGVFLAALLTTVIRPALPTAPAFLVRAHAPGTGKTLLSECLMLLVGARPSAMPLPDNAEEVEKRLFAKLLAGCAGMILDNLTGTIDGAALCAFLTSPEPEGRILGKSETPRVSNRALWVLNGNNVSAGGDTFRRILPVSLDANDEHPERRRFDFNPREVIRGNLDAYRANLLSVLLTYQWEGAPIVGAGAFGSFDEWEALVRQCVCWLIREGVTPAPMADPLDVLALNKAEDPRHQQHAAILEAWHDYYGEASVRVKEIVALVNESEGFSRFDGFACKPPLSSSEQRARAFVEAVREITPPRDRFTGRYFGAWLKAKRGVIVNGYRLDIGTRGKKEPGWRITRLA